MDAYLARVRRRAALFALCRALVAAVGLGALAFGIVAAIVGPLGDAALTWVGWALIATVVSAAMVWGWRSFSPLRGAGAARLLGAHDAALPSAARSAYELGRDRPPAASEALIAAHREQVRAQLRALPPSRVVRWRELRHRAVAIGLLGLAAAGLVLSTQRAGAGAYALVHPGERDATGDRVAVAFSDVEARLVYPSYLDRESDVVVDPTILEVPRGTSIELRARARLEATAATLRVGARALPMERDGEGRFFVRFVVREDESLHLRLRRDEGEWVRDATEREVRALPDEAPAVTILNPLEDVLLEEPADVLLSWEVADDVGVASVDLVVRPADGEERRRRVGTFPETDRPARTSGTETVDVTLLGLAPGDRVTVWLEARDGDVVSGPNVGRSAARTITLASEATLRERRLASLEAVLDRAIHTLADRLEREVPDEIGPARERQELLAQSGEGFVTALREYAEAIRGEEGTRPTDVAIYRAMASRVRRLVHEERMAHRGGAAKSRREAVDERAVTELEDDVLALDELLGRARVADAAEIARELESIRREIRSLLAELRRSESPEARQRLLAAIGRAQQRMAELGSRLAQMGTSVPREFMNQGEAAARETADQLAGLREAVQRGDLEAAERMAGELEHQIDQIARALGQTEEGIAEGGRFGPRERAMANAMEGLASLEGEQQQLSEHGTERRSRAAGRALEAMGGQDNRAGRRLATRTREVRDALQQIDRARLAGFEQDAYDRARQRLVDTEDALSAGDLGEARRMAQTAAQDVSALARDLDLSALMFPGHEGETSDDARAARRSDQQLRELRRELDEALPDVASHLDARDRTQMRADLERQRAALDAARQLGESFGEGPDGVPLDEDAPRELGDAAREMEDASRSLDRGDPLESARLQEAAARRITELRERLENQQRGGGGGGGEGSSRDDFRRPVEIPDADQFEGPMEMRRRILDAMRESPPRGYEDAVRRYYEGLLR